MEVFLYCPKLSVGALELAAALRATRLRRFDGEYFWAKGGKVEPKPGDVIICWGQSCPELEGVRVLNGMDMPMSYTKMAKQIALMKIPILTLWHAVNGYDPATFVGRAKIHKSGNDLLIPGIKPDYWTPRQKFVEEYRIHSFGGRSIRSGVKVPRAGYTVVKADEWQPNSNMTHPWVRTVMGGWRVKYEGFQSDKEMRAIAHGAIKAVGLTFAAVDIGKISDGKYMIIDINRAPILEGFTLSGYVKAISRWIEGHKEEADDVPVEVPQVEPPPADPRLAAQDDLMRLIERQRRAVRARLAIRPDRIIARANPPAPDNEWVGRLHAVRPELRNIDEDE